MKPVNALAAVRAATIAAIAGLLLCSAPGASHGARAGRLAFDNADLATVVEAVSRITGKTFLFDPSRVRGTLSMIGPDDVTPARALELLESALALHGYALVPQGDDLWIVESDALAQYEVRVIPLRYAKAHEVATALLYIAPPGVRVAPYPPTNSVIVSGYRQDVDQLEDAIRRR